MDPAFSSEIRYRPLDLPAAGGRLHPIELRGCEVETSISHRCRQCGSSLPDPFYRADDRPVCDRCATTLREAADSHTGSAARNLLAAAVGLVTALALAPPFALLWKQFGPLAGVSVLLTGTLVALAMGKVSGGRAGVPLRVTALILGGMTYLFGRVLFAYLNPGRFTIAPSLSISDSLWIAAVQKIVYLWDLIDWVLLIVPAASAFTALRPATRMTLTGPYPLKTLDPMRTP